MPIAAPSIDAQSCRAFHKSSTVAPAIVGMARKNENSVAASRVTPISKAPTIVAPEREVPGIIARHWNNPILAAVGIDISSVLAQVDFGRHRSAASIAIPPTINAQPTTVEENKTRLMKS